LDWARIERVTRRWGKTQAASSAFGKATIMAISQQQINRAVDLAKSYGVTRLILFGSAAENPAEARDLDLACDGVPGWKFYELGGRLEEELHAVVDLVPLCPPTPFTRLVERRGKVLL